MYLKKINKARHTLAFRLTFWYAGIFMLTSCVAFFFFYFLITSVIQDRTDQDADQAHDRQGIHPGRLHKAGKIAPAETGPPQEEMYGWHC